MELPDSFALRREGCYRNVAALLYAKKTAIAGGVTNNLYINKHVPSQVLRTLITPIILSFFREKEQTT